MGTYDTIIVWMRCPYCEEFRKFDCQTKDLNNTLDYYEAVGVDETKICALRILHPLKLKGLGYINKECLEPVMAVPLPFSEQLKYVNVIADCKSFYCQWWGDRRDVIEQGVPSGFGRAFRGKIPIRKIGKFHYFIGKLIDVELDDLKEGDLDKYKDHLKEFKSNFEEAMKKYKHEPLALRYMYRLY